MKGENKMNKFKAKVKFEDCENEIMLIRTFFEFFNSESSITVDKKEAKIEIEYAFEEKPPMEIIDAINDCEIIHINYSKNLKEAEQEEVLQNETEKNDSEQEKNLQTETKSDSERKNVEVEIIEQTEQANAESKNFNQNKFSPKIKTEQLKKVEKKPTVNIPELDEIAKKSNSFEHFTELVAEWLEMSSKKEYFKNLVIAASEVDNITWKNLGKILENKNIIYTDGDRINTSQCVSKKLKKYSITCLPFLKATKKYKDYSFKKVEERPPEENTSEQEIKNTITSIEDNKPDQIVFLKPRVKMECMPESKEFEEKLANVDKTQQVEERVRYVLGAMGLSNMVVEEQKQIVEFATTAIKKGKINLDDIFIKTNTAGEQTITVRMMFSKLVNDFVQKYESNKKVKLSTFLSELQKIIMDKTEFESSVDCAE